MIRKIFSVRCRQFYAVFIVFYASNLPSCSSVDLGGFFILGVAIVSALPAGRSNGVLVAGVMSLLWDFNIVILSSVVAILAQAAKNWLLLHSYNYRVTPLICTWITLLGP